jgi:Cyclic nucleotide-binding domain
MRTDSSGFNGTACTVAIGHSLEQAVDAGGATAGEALIETRLAISAEEIHAVERFRYEIYVDELYRYGGRADHEQRRLADPEDDTSWVWYATEGNEILASVRITLGGHGFSARQIDQYHLATFLDELPPGLLAVGERLMIRPSRRNGDVLQSMSTVIDPFHRRFGVQVMFGACEPHLMSSYCAMNAPRPYSERNINHPDAGYLIPTITLLDGPEPLRAATGGILPRCIEEVLSTTGAIRSPFLEDPDQYQADLLLAIDAIGHSVFDGLAPDEVAACTMRSIVIGCAEGDRILRRGGAARNVYVVLDGALEVRDSGQRVAGLGPGDVFGETAFLLHCPRTFDVDVQKGGTRLLAISERTLRHLTADSPTAAAKVFANLATLLSSRLHRASGQPRPMTGPT